MVIGSVSMCHRMISPRSTFSKANCGRPPLCDPQANGCIDVDSVAFRKEKGIFWVSCPSSDFVVSVSSRSATGLKKEILSKLFGYCWRT
jgi:hypothetical protein